MLWLGLLVGIFAILLWVRANRLSVLRSEVLRRLRAGSGQVNGLAHDVSRLTGESISAAELSAYGGLTVAEYVWSWATIDPTVIKAAAFSSSTGSIDSGLEYTNWLTSHLASMSPEAQEGFLNRLQGYVGEQHVADLLVASGHIVEVATTANQPVWDLVIDGRLANVKTVANVGTIKAEALAHPTVTYIIPEDVAGHGPENIIALGGFKYDAVTGSLSESVATAKGETAMHSLGVHVPWITIGFAAYRNYKLVKLGKDRGLAVEHAVVESVGRGVGLLLGGKAGSELGRVLGGPVGAMVGGVLGGVGGAIAGGALADGWKQRHLRNAVAELKTSLHEFGQGFEGNLEGLNASVMAPVRSAEYALRVVWEEVGRCQSSWRWWFYPDFYSVMMVEASNVGAQRLKEAQLSARATSRIITLARITKHFEDVGLLMINSPELCTFFGFDRAKLDRVHAARARVFDERKKLDPTFEPPV